MYSKWEDAWGMALRNMEVGEQEKEIGRKDTEGGRRVPPATTDA